MSLCVLGRPPLAVVMCVRLFVGPPPGCVVDTQTHRACNSVLLHAVLFSSHFVDGDSISPLLGPSVWWSLLNPTSPCRPPFKKHSLFVSHPNMSRIPPLTSLLLCAPWLKPPPAEKALQKQPPVRPPGLHSCSLQPVVSLVARVRPCHPPIRDLQWLPGHSGFTPRRPSFLLLSATPPPLLPCSAPLASLLFLHQIPPPGMLFPQIPTRLLL